MWNDGKILTLDIDEVKLEGRCFGPAPDSAPTVVLLHEGLGSIALWRDFPEKLARVTGYGVFAFSRRGYGQSDPAILPRPLDYMTSEAVDALPKVLDAIGFRSGVLVGHSDGASIAAIYGGSVQDHRVRGLVLMAPHFFTEKVGLASIETARAAYETGELRARLGKYHKDVDNAFFGWADAWLDPAFKDWNIEEVIAYIRVPVLAIQGVDDQYGTRAQIEALETQSYNPVDVAMLADCGHGPHVEQPEKTLALLVDYLKRLDRIEAAKAETA
ncbi:alpha/beta hydrolase [Aquibium carbonis]|uniref:Alpha/beta hydrolase n=1 Tax=Aquibium carbonis TaxID=2495581 RepID=A0A429YWZ9_9HYPH|nr:alpha/beta hydrolase [Aquibium carbonis]RST85979.1 alpha/beta hydrolase [Aquibium carbonis]